MLCATDGLWTEIMGKYLWLAVEADQYELPLVVADSARELAEKCGTTKHNIETFVCKQSSGRTKGYKYIKVSVEENG